ncbi:MAG: PAS domain S-box protein [Chloroflexota bacterium]
MSTINNIVGDLRAEITALRERVVELEATTTEHHQIEDTYRNLVEHTPHAMVILQDQRIVFANLATVAISGYQIGELTSLPGQSMHTLVHTDDQKKLDAVLTNTDNEFTPTQHSELRLIRNDGTIRWIDLSSTTTTYRGSSAIQLVFLDITEQKRAEDVLQESEITLHAIFYNSPQVFLFVNLDYTIRALNHIAKDRFKQIFGKVVDVGDSLFDILTSDLLPVVQERFQQTLLGKRITSERKMTTTSGRDIWFEFQYNAVSNNEGHPIGVFLSIVDMTERKQGEERLRLLESVIVHTNDAVVITEAAPINKPGPRIIYVNDAFKRMTGYTEAEVIGQNPRMFQGSETNRATLNQIRQALQNWQPIRVELINYHKNGQPFWIELDISPVVDASGQYTHWVSIQRDISERKEMESSLQANQDLFQGIIDNAPAVICAGDLEGRFILANKTLTDGLGLSHTQELIGKSYKDIVMPDLHEQVARENQHILTTAQQIQQESTVIVDGAEQTWLATKFPVFDSQGIIAYIAAISTDITNQKQTEATLRATTSRLITLIENLQAGILVEDETRHIALVNGVFCEMFNIPVGPHVLFGTDCRQAANAAKDLFVDSDYFADSVEGLLQQKQTVTAEELELVDGRVFERDYIPIYVNEKYRGHLWQYRDITERKNAEKELHQYTERLQALYDLDQAILSARSPIAIGEAALQHLQQLLPCINACVTEFHLHLQQTRLLALLRDGILVPPPINRFALENCDEVLETLQQGHAYILEKHEELVVPHEIQNLLGDKTHLIVPLLVQDTLIGALNIGIEDHETVPDDYIIIAKEIAASLAIAIRHAQLYEQTQHDAETKATMLREVNHRVKNNLSAIIGLLYAEQRRAELPQQDIYQAIINELVIRVQSLASVHNLLSHSAWQPVRLDELVRNIVQLAVQALPPDKLVTINIDESDILITADQAHNLALVINELATNTVKYGGTDVTHTLRLCVHFTVADDQVYLEFRDNGPGYPDPVLCGDEQHLHVGFDLMHNIIRRSLHGQLTLRNDGGAIAMFQFRRELTTI